MGWGEGFFQSCAQFVDEGRETPNLLRTTIGKIAGLATDEIAVQRDDN